MRRLVGPVVTLVGAFLVAIGLFAQFYMGHALLKTPLDVDEIIDVDGQAQVAERGADPGLPLDGNLTRPGLRDRRRVRRSHRLRPGRRGEDRAQR